MKSFKLYECLSSKYGSKKLNYCHECYNKYMQHVVLIRYLHK